MMFYIALALLSILALAGIPIMVVATRADRDARGSVNPPNAQVGRRNAPMGEAPLNQDASERNARWLVETSLSDLKGGPVPPDALGVGLLTEYFMKTYGAEPSVAAVERLEHQLRLFRTRPAPLEDISLPVRDYNQLKRLHVHNTWDLLVTPWSRVGSNADAVRTLVEGWVGESFRSAVNHPLGQAEVFQDRSGNFRFRVTRGGVVLLTSEAFASREAALELAMDTLVATPSAESIEDADTSRRWD